MTVRILCFAITFFLLAPLCSAASKKGDPFKPKMVPMELKEFTDLTLDIVPGLGTRLIFPFVVTDEALEPPFTQKITDERLFKIPQISDGNSELQNQNVYVIHASPGDKTVSIPHLSNLFLSVNGYNISIMLRTTTDLRKHVSDVRFTLSEEDQSYLISKVVERKISVLQKDYEKRKSELDKQSKKQALKHLGVVALNEPDITPFREGFESRLDTGERFGIEVSEALNYADTFYMLRYSMENNSSDDVVIHETKLVSLAEDNEVSITVQASCPKVIDSDDDVECMLISQSRLLAESDSLELRIITNRGEVIAKW